MGEAPEPRRSGARDRAHRRRGALLLSRREDRAHRAAHDPQRVPVAVGRADPQPRPVLRLQASSPASASPGASADIVVFEPKDGLRYGHSFWSDATTGLLLKARLVNEKGEVVEQFAFTDVDGQREDRQGHGEAVVGVGAGGLAGEAGRRRRGRDERHRLDRRASSRPASPRSARASASCAASPIRWRISCSPTGWSRQRVHRAVHRDADADRPDAGRRPHSLQHAQRRVSA